MNDLPRISPVPVEAWTGPDDDPVPLWRSVGLWAAPFVGVLLLSIVLPRSVPWVLGAVGVVTAVRVVREIRRARRRTAHRQ